jgi:hypothetical protein
MKYLALTIGIVGILPLTLFLRSKPSARNQFWILVGLIPFITRVVPFFDIALITWHDFWWGHVPALQVTAIDLVAVAIYFTVRHQTNSIRYHFPFLLYLAAISLSAFLADMPMGAVFYVWQFIRIYFLTVVIAKACTDETVPLQLMKGMAIGLAIQFVVIFWQKFGLHLVQPTGTFYHQNTLGLITHLVVFPHFSLLLAGKRQIQNAATSMIGLIIASLIASRAALGFSVFGFVATYVFSLLGKWTNWKALIGTAGFFAVAVMAPIAYSSLEQRFEVAPLMEHEYDERAAFNRTALSILEARPLGIGANHYSYFGKNYGFSIRAGVAPNEGSLNNIVHNAYLLNAAEAGYPGLISYIILSMYPLWIAWKYSWRDRNNPKCDLLLGLGTAMLTIYLHSLFEYIIMIKEVQYVLAIVVGMTFGVAHQIKAARKTGRIEAAASQRGLQTAGRLLR